MSRSGRERGHKKLPKSWRGVVAERDGGECWLCGKALDVERATLDHVLPRSMGGQDALDNLRLAHFRCNVRRSSDVLASREDRMALREGRFGTTPGEEVPGER